MGIVFEGGGGFFRIFTIGRLRKNVKVKEILSFQIRQKITELKRASRQPTKLWQALLSISIMTGSSRFLGSLMIIVLLSEMPVNFFM